MEISVRRVVALEPEWRKLRASATAAKPARAQPMYRNHDDVSKRSLPVEIEGMTSAFAVVRNVLDLFRRPGFELEIMRDDARALLDLLFQQRLHLFVDRLRQQ